MIQDMVRPLKQWLLRHRQNPYPTKSEKIELAMGSNMSLVQVSNWFANARRRLKNVVQDPRCSWSKRLRMYNQFVQGNAELLSISSTDSIWNSDSENEDDNDDDDEGHEGEDEGHRGQRTRSGSDDRKLSFDDSFKPINLISYLQVRSMSRTPLKRRMISFYPTAKTKKKSLLRKPS